MGASVGGVGLEVGDKDGLLKGDTVGLEEGDTEGEEEGVAVTIVGGVGDRDGASVG